MADLYSNTADGYVFASNQTSWANARDHAGAYKYTTSTRSTAAVAVSRATGRGGAVVYGVYRSFFYFDTSGITGTVSSATLKLYGYVATDGSVIAVKSTAFGGDGGTALDAADFNNITGYSAGASLSGSATDYSSEITSGWSTSGYNDLASTADLRADMQNDDVVIICVMDYTNDYTNTALTSSASLNCGIYFTDYTGTSRDPYITYEVAAASGYGNDVIGVATANIGKVDGVATANIEKVIGV